jgi:hypothetical protein
MQELAGGARAGLTPGKTYEYVASGRPILAAVPPGDARDLLVEAGTARICSPSDVGAMTAILREAVGRWRRGEPQPALNEKVAAKYERLELTRRLAGVFDDVLAESVAIPTRSEASVVSAGPRDKRLNEEGLRLGIVPRSMESAEIRNGSVSR